MGGNRETHPHRELMFTAGLEVLDRERVAAVIRNRVGGVDPQLAAHIAAVLTTGYAVLRINIVSSL